MFSTLHFREKWLENQPKLARCPKGNFSRGVESDSSFQGTWSSCDPFSPWGEMSCPLQVPSMRTAQDQENFLQPFHLVCPHWKPWEPASAALQRLLWWNWHHQKGQVSPWCHPELLQAQLQGAGWDIEFDLAQMASFGWEDQSKSDAW